MRKLNPDELEAYSAENPDNPFPFTGRIVRLIPFSEKIAGWIRFICGNKANT